MAAAGRAATPEVDYDLNVTSLYAAIGRSDWSAAEAAVRSNPAEAAAWVVRHDRNSSFSSDGDGADGVEGASQGAMLWRFLPLHSACARDPPANFIRALLAAHPEAASLKDESGTLPLHYACGNRASNSVIGQLIECHPAGVREEDAQGNLPIHYLGQWGVGEEGVLELLLSAYPEGVNTLNGEGMRPLDLCQEGNYDGWEAVAEALQKEARRTRRTGSAGSRGRRPEVPGERDVDSLLSATIEVPKKAKSPRSSSRDRRRERSSSRAGRQRSASRSRRSQRASIDGRDEHASRGRDGSTLCSDGRDEAPSTPRIHRHLTTRSLGGVDRSYRSARSVGSRPLSLVLPLASPKYHERKTPRSSGRGPGFSFGPKTPRTTRSTQSVEFAFEDREPATLDAATLQDEVGELQARLADAQLLQAENLQLTKENERLRARLAEVSQVVELAAQREGKRVRASAERREVLVQLLAREDEEEGLARELGVATGTLE